MKPFVKWAGGKKQLLNEIRENYPLELGGSIKKYCEPFVGGGAVLFDIISKYKFEEVLINDINKELINTYSQIKSNLKSLLKELETMQNTYWDLNIDERKVYYYEKRDRFNYLKVNANLDLECEKAALFIFLNKTCFNGLFRVNSKGLFNVPMGVYKKPLICDNENLTEVSLALQNVKIITGEYDTCADFIDKDTFVYIDPPYRPISKTSSFTSYSEISFDDDKQKALGDFADRMSKLGAKILISNSDPKNYNDEDDFFENVYINYNITRVNAKRSINSNGSGRGSITELLIKNY
jgi:DNA adenine methylase